MSCIFDALQRSESDRSGVEARRGAGRDATTSDPSSDFASCFGAAVTRAGGGAASATVTGMVRLDLVTVPSGALARSVSS